MLHAHCCLRGEDERRKIKQAGFLLLPAESSAVGTLTTWKKDSDCWYLFAWQIHGCAEKDTRHVPFLIIVYPSILLATGAFLPTKTAITTITAISNVNQVMDSSRKIVANNIIKNGCIYCI